MRLPLVELDRACLDRAGVPLPDAGGLAQTRYRITATVKRHTDLGCGLAFYEPTPEVLAAIAILTDG